MVTAWEPVYCRHPCDPIDRLVSVVHNAKAFKYSYDVSLCVLLFLYDSYKVMREGAQCILRHLLSYGAVTSCTFFRTHTIFSERFYANKSCDAEYTAVTLLFLIFNPFIR